KGTLASASAMTEQAAQAVKHHAAKVYRGQRSGMGGAIRLDLEGADVPDVLRRIAVDTAPPSIHLDLTLAEGTAVEQVGHFVRILLALVRAELAAKNVRCRCRPSGDQPGERNQNAGDGQPNAFTQHGEPPFKQV